MSISWSGAFTSLFTRVRPSLDGMVLPTLNPPKLFSLVWHVRSFKMLIRLLALDMLAFCSIWMLWIMFTSLAWYIHHHPKWPISLHIALIVSNESIPEFEPCGCWRKHSSKVISKSVRLRDLACALILCQECTLTTQFYNHMSLVLIRCCICIIRWWNGYMRLRRCLSSWMPS